MGINHNSGDRYSRSEPTLLTMAPLSVSSVSITMVVEGKRIGVINDVGCLSRCTQYLEFQGIFTVTEMAIDQRTQVGMSGVLLDEGERHVCKQLPISYMSAYINWI